MLNSLQKYPSISLFPNFNLTIFTLVFYLLILRTHFPSFLVLLIDSFCNSPHY